MTQLKLFNAILPALGNLSSRPPANWVSTGRFTPTGKPIMFNANGSNHNCDDRCTHARGDKCECSCGGKNHGIYRIAGQFRI
jgi:hypothetical protein